MYAYMYICMYIHIYIYIFMYTWVFLFVCMIVCDVCACVFLCECVCVCVVVGRVQPLQLLDNTLSQVCVGCQKVVCILLFGVVYIFAHPTHLNTCQRRCLYDNERYCSSEPTA